MSVIFLNTGLTSSLENVKTSCSRDIFGRIMHNKFRKNITVSSDYFYWNVILLNGLKCEAIFQLKSSTSTAEKIKCPWWFSFIFIMLRWFWNFLIISVTDLLLTGSSDKNLRFIPKFSTRVSKYDLNVSATS